MEVVEFATLEIVAVEAVDGVVVLGLEVLENDSLVPVMVFEEVAKFKAELDELPENKIEEVQGHV